MGVACKWGKSHSFLDCASFCWAHQKSPVLQQSSVELLHLRGQECTISSARACCALSSQWQNSHDGFQPGADGSVLSLRVKWWAYKLISDYYCASWHYVDSWHKNIAMEDLMMILHWFNSTGISAVIFYLRQRKHTLTEAPWQGVPSCELYIASDIIRKILVLHLFCRMAHIILTSLNSE